MKVIITGITGQDGSHMADYLLKNTKAQVYGLVRQLSVPNHNNIAHLKDNARVHLIEGDITCPHSMSGIVRKIQPDYFINFAANSFVQTSWDNPTQVVETNEVSVLHQLEAIRRECPTCRYYQAGSSEEFGDVIYSPQDEKHPLRPRSMYGKSKAGARLTVKVYRESYKLYAVAGWLFNHEGTRRGKQFVTRKITSNIARIKKELDAGITNPKPFLLGNLDARRDWSDAEDFVDGVWRMLNQEDYRPELKAAMYHSKGQLILPFDEKTRNTEILSALVKDYVLSSGETHTINEFIEEAFEAAGIKVHLLNGTSPMKAPVIDSQGLNWDHRLDQWCYQRKDKRGTFVPLVQVDDNLFRPNEVNLLQGNSTLAREELGWKPQTSFRDLVKKMVEFDIKTT